MKSKFLCIALLMLMSLNCAGAIAASDRPLSVRDLLKLLGGGVYSSRVVLLVQSRGISFTPNADYLESLRRAGGDDGLVRAVATAHQIASQFGQVPVPPTNQSQHPTPNLATPPSRDTLDVERRLSSTPVASDLAAPSLSIPVGTTITIHNWRRYQEYMPFGMAGLFAGTYFWKMPPDVEIVVGPTIRESLPSGYVEATTKYSDRVRIIHLPDGRYDIQNYTGGEPFPNPRGPDKGYKVLANLWFAYMPHLLAGTSSNPLKMCAQSGRGYINCVQLSYVYRQTAYNTDPAVHDDDAANSRVWYTEWSSIEEPEELKYTARLVLYFKDGRHPQEVFTFVPSLRRWLRGSLASRCGTIPGTDFVQDDYKRVCFNGGIGLFSAEFLRRAQILALTGDYAGVAGAFPENYYMPLGWPKPAWGRWQIRDVDVIDVRRIPSQRAGYCYGKRIIYADSETHYALWEDAYDTNMRLWKIALVAQRLVKATSLGHVPGGLTASAWDIINKHMTNVSTQDQSGHDVLVDDDVPAQYDNYVMYSTPAGLAQIMK